MGDNLTVQPRNILREGWESADAFNSSSSARSLTKRSKSYVGIDFGTSTTVVSVISRLGNGKWQPIPLQIPQPRPEGGCYEDAIVNSVLAWRGDQLYFGKPAYQIKQNSAKSVGKTVFASFKMGLGVNLGPTYPKTSLSHVSNSAIIIETAKDAAREFFKLLLPLVRTALAENGLSPDAEFAVSVPASFQVNQRQDLRDALSEAGISITEDCFIDEPNAAFLSYLFESSTDAETVNLNEVLSQKPLNILVYDFGAGTCDVSILSVSLEDNSGKRRLLSRNRAISRFTALGGDNIDRAIARKVLLPQLLEGNNDLELTQRNIDESLVPILIPKAEELKIAYCNWLQTQGIETLEELREITHTVECGSVPPIKIQGRILQIEHPNITAEQFADIMSPFVGNADDDEASDNVFAPVSDALKKAALDASELYGVLFIGGSNHNVLVRRCIMDALPAGTKAIIPSNLRCHVSQGAAIHSASFHGFKQDVICPITSENICVVTQGERLETLVRASTPVPSDEFTHKVKVAKEFQNVIELPICLGSPNKLMGVLELRGGRIGFEKGATITIQGHLTHEKLLSVEAKCGDRSVSANLQNPRSNKELSKRELEYLRALQKFNEAMLADKDNIPRSLGNEMVVACKRTKRYLEAADYSRWLDKVHKTDEATDICYYYSMAGESAKSRVWGKKAYERDPSALNAYNCACGAIGEEKESFLRISLEKDPDYFASLCMLGHILKNRGSNEGIAMLRRATEIMEPDLDGGYISRQNTSRLKRAAEALGLDSLKDKAQAHLDKLDRDEEEENTRKAYKGENLAASINANELVRR